MIDTDFERISYSFLKSHIMTEVKTRNLTTLAKQVYEANKAKGFWDNERNVGEIFMLIISEAAEALEGHRKGKFADLAGFDERLDLLTTSINLAIEQGSTKDEYFAMCFKNYIKDSFEDELADVVIRCLDFIGSRDYCIDEPEIDTLFSDNVGEMLCDVCEYIISARTAIEQRCIDEAVEERLQVVINECYSIAAKLNFDLDRHIELKLKYNATRPYKHGKKY